MSLDRLVRTCWWCGARLMAVAHAEVKIHNDDVVWVHLQCRPDVESFIKTFTANFPDPAPRIPSE